MKCLNMNQFISVCFSDVVNMACPMRTLQLQSTVREKRNEMTNRTEEERKSKDSPLGTFFSWFWFFKPIGAKEFQKEGV